MTGPMLPDTVTAAAPSPLSQASRAAVAQALSAYRQRVKADEAAAAGTQGTFTKIWTDLIGTDTTAAAVRTAAGTGAKLLAVYEVRAGRLTTDAEAAELVRSVAFELAQPGLTALADSLSFTGAAKDVGAASLRDAAVAAQTIGGGWLAVLKASPYLVAAVLLVIAWSWLRPRRAA